MIENVELYNDTKIQLKHMCIDKNTPLKTWMVAGAEYVFDNNVALVDTPANDTYTSYTLDISSNLKHRILTYVNERDAKIRDFWVTVSNIIIESPELLE